MRKFYNIVMMVMVLIIFLSTVVSLRQRFVEMRVSRINREIYRNYEILQGLKAEWNYLNNKGYLEEVVGKYMPELSEEIRQFDVKNMK